MKKFLVLTGIALFLSLVAFPADKPAAPEKEVLTGEFVWSQGASGDLEAIFTPSGKGIWEVDFNFEFRGKPHTYSGTAEGSLTDGSLKGKVFNEGKNRTFTFDGAFDDGSFSGSHAEIDGKSEQRTGTLTLGR